MNEWNLLMATAVGMLCAIMTACIVFFVVRMLFQNLKQDAKTWTERKNNEHL